MAYSAAAQARSVVGLIDELGLELAVIAGYDIGSRIAQAIARERPRSASRARPLAAAAGRRRARAEPDAKREFWYQASIGSSLVEELLDGDPVAVRAYLRALLDSLVGPAFTPGDARLDHHAAPTGRRAR